MEDSTTAHTGMLLGCLEPYGPAITRLHLATRARVLAVAPDANELIYDAYNAVTCAYGFTLALGGSFCHVAAYPKHVNLGFGRGAELPDPEGLLAGSGKRIRHVRIGCEADLDRDGLTDLIRAGETQGRIAAEGRAGAGSSRLMSVSERKRRPGS